MPHTLLPPRNRANAKSMRLEQDGWTILRFWNNVIRDIDNVCQHITIAAGADRR
jgi:very-short-patch-repair endonuclease